MATAVINYDLTDFDDIKAHKRAIKSMDLALALYSIHEYFHDLDRHPPANRTEGESKLVTKIGDDIREILTSYDVDVFELID